MHGIRVGISGWRYGGWRGGFYPEWLPQRLELNYASRVVNSIEINGSFYSLQRPAYYHAWFNETPDDFIFSVKGSRYITHMKKLRDARAGLANFLASGMLRLGHKLGPFLWQFPKFFPPDEARFRAFLELLPRDMEQAAAIAREHTLKGSGRAWTEIEENHPLRHAFEMRHPDFVDDRFFDLLAEYNASWVIADAAGLFPFCEEATADFVYIRLHGATELYASGYGEAELQRWAQHIRRLAAGKPVPGAKRCSKRKITSDKPRDVYVYFDNDAKVFAPFNAIRLAGLLDASPIVSGQGTGDRRQETGDRREGTGDRRQGRRAKAR